MYHLILATICASLPVAYWVLHIRSGPPSSPKAIFAWLFLVYGITELALAAHHWPRRRYCGVYRVGWEGEPPGPGWDSFSAGGQVVPLTGLPDI